MIHDDALPERITSCLQKDGLVIFLFHGVIPKQIHPVRNYTGKHIKKDLFARCMARLSKMGHALSMDDVLQCCETATPFPPQSYAVTFDDGFENNFSVAAPILGDFHIPATIYVTSGFVENNGMSWIDRVEYAVERAAEQTVKVDWSSESFILADVSSRIYFLKSVRQYVKNAPDCHADTFADSLCAYLGITEKPKSEDPLDLKMSWEQVAIAAKSSLLTIGGHGHTHAILSFLSPNELANELDMSLKLLQEKGGVAPIHYSYPEGLSHCYSGQVIEALKYRGVRCCPTAMGGVNRTGENPFHLKRIIVG